MKRHYWQYLIDSAGNAVSGARVHVFLANSVTYANVYLTEAGSPVTTEHTEILTDVDGMFDFWIADLDTSPTYGYAHTQRFKLTWSKAGLVTGGMDYIDIVWPSDTFKVKLEDSDTEDFLSQKIVAGFGITVTPSAGQLVISLS